MSISIKEFSKAWWTEVYNRIIGATVFLDDYSAECLHWEGGLYNLISHGTVTVKGLSPFEVISFIILCTKYFCLRLACMSNIFKKQTGTGSGKAVFITQATSTQLRIICEIIRRSDITHCTLISCVSLEIVYLEMNEGKDVSDAMLAGKAQAEATSQLENMLKEALKKKVGPEIVISVV